MRSLNRNRRLIWWARQIDTQELLDPEGNRTGQYAPVYSETETLHLFVSAAAGDAQATLFGQQLQYDRVASTAWQHCPLDEECVVWLDNDPVDDPPDYLVVQVARWKNSAVYALRKVDMGAPQGPGIV